MNRESIRSRIESLERRAYFDEEEEFHKFVDGEYDPTKSLEENLCNAEFPPEVLPRPLSEDIEERLSKEETDGGNVAATE